MAVWLAFQTWLVLRVFGFPKPIHGFTYSLIDTGADLIMGVTPCWPSEIAIFFS